MTGANHQDRLLGGLSWSHELDLEELLAAVSDPAPWERDVDKSSSRPAAAPVAADTASAPADAGAVHADVGSAASNAVQAHADALAHATIRPAPLDADAELAEYLEAVEAGRSREVPLTAVAGRMVESVSTGPGLAGWLAVGQVTGLDDGALAGVAASYRRLASWAQAGELSAVAELASRSAAADERIGVDAQGRPDRLPDEACAEVSLALTMSHVSASWWTDLGVTLRWRLAATGAALQAGRIDLGRARAIAEATALLDEETARAVEARMLAGAGAKTMAQLRAALRRAVIAADPKGAERRREEAERQAKVVLYPEAEGTASLAGYSLPGVRAAAAMARISALAQALKASGAGGGIDLLRAQVFLGLLLGTLPYIPPPTDVPPSPPDGDPPDNGDLPDNGHLPHNDDLPDNGHPPHNDDPPHNSGLLNGGGARSRAPAGCPGRDDNRSSHRGNARGGQGARPPPAWPEVSPILQPGPAAMDYLSPATGGLLDLRLPWATLIGQSLEPGYLGRLGPITATQARYLAGLAARDPCARWLVIVTDPVGRAVAVARLTPAPSRAAHQDAGLVGQVTVTVGPQDLAEPQHTASLPPIQALVLIAAQSAAARAAADAEATGGCAHAAATLAYRPTRRLWEHVTARDLTCRFLTCGQPATRCDLDHTIPFDQGGRTCSCNLGGVCRFHHQIKQHPRWHLTQPTAGAFSWTTPTGRTYTVQPDSYAA